MGEEVIFESEHIYYVPLNEKFVHDYLEMVNDPEVARNISDNVRTYTYEEELQWVIKKLEEKSLCFSMIEKSTGDFIGNIEIRSIHDRIGELGISITAKKQNQHYGTEAIQALLKYAYEKLNLDGMDLNVFATNLRAIRCYEKVGFVQDGMGETEKDIHMKIIK